MRHLVAIVVLNVDDEDRGGAKCDTLGGTQKTMLINESGPAWERYMGANLR